MPQRVLPFPTKQLPRVALLLWVAYFFVLALVDWLLIDHHINVLFYYAFQLGNGLFILGLTLLPWPQFWQRRAMMPVTLALMAILPTITVHLMLRLAPSALLRSPDSMTLRLMPILLIGLLLTAWHYRWPSVVLFSLGIALLNFAGISLPTIAQGTIPHIPPGALFITGIQAITFLMVGFITSTLVEHLRMQQHSLEVANAQLRDHASTQVELTISHERNRMARELHDTLAHTLSGLTVQLQTVKAYWELDPATSQKMLDEALVATRHGLQETRQALKSLRATPLEDLGLALALRQLAEAAAERANLKLTLSIAEPLPFFTLEVSHTLYRVAQEAIMNVVYHANAKTLSVSLSMTEDGTRLTVMDDGSGFDTDQGYPNHWGVKGMRERAQLVGSQLLIKSCAGHGTTIQLTISEKLS